MVVYISSCQYYNPSYTVDVQLQEIVQMTIGSVSIYIYDNVLLIQISL